MAEVPKSTRKPYVSLDYEDKEVACTLFALGAGVMYVTRIMRQRGKNVHHVCLVHLKERLIKSGQLQKRKEEIGTVIPLVDKHIRIFSIQKDIQSIDDLIAVGAGNAYLQLMQLKAKLLHQIGEEMGAFANKQQHEFGTPLTVILKQAEWDKQQ